MSIFVGKRMSVKTTINGSEDDVENIVSDLLLRATESVDYSSGFHTPFYGRANVVKAFEKAADRVDSFRLLLDSDVNLDEVKKEQSLAWVFNLQKQGKIEIRQSQEKIPHRIIIDERDFRLETDHDKKTGGSTNYVVKNADDSVEDITTDIISEFNENWEASQPVK